jgi:hypothetical protein
MPAAEVPNVRFGVLIAWLAPAVLAVGALGAYPTWAKTGPAGLIAEAAAAAIVLAVMIGSGALIMAMSSLGAAKMAYIFVMSAVPRVLVCMVLAAVTWALLDVPSRPMLLWTAGFYLVALVSESIWLHRALTRR